MRVRVPPAPRLRAAAPILATLAATLLALPVAAAAAEPGDLLTAAPYRADWVPSKAAQAYLLSYHTPDHSGRLAQGTGLLYLPAGTAPAGGWPVLVQIAIIPFPAPAGRPA